MKLLVQISLLGISTIGYASIEEYYELETVQLPVELAKVVNSTQVDGLDFFPDGRLATCFVDGQVYTLNPKTREWKLFADGLHSPLGIVVLNNKEMVVCQRPEVSKLRDNDGDGVADEFEVLSDDFGISGNYHEFNFGPVRDGAGNFYFSLGTASSGAGVRYEKRGLFNPLSYMDRMYACVPYRGWVLKITPDGKTIPWASGFRTPNGLGFDLEGNLFVTDNQGDWVGTSKMHHVQQDKFYGHAGSLLWREDWEGRPLDRPIPELDAIRTKAAVLFPHGAMANSPTQPLVDSTDGKFGPFAGQLFVGEMNKGRIMRVALERVRGGLQGMCIPFFDGSGLKRGNNRMVFGPDHSMWIGHSNHGWAGEKGLQKIRWKGKVPFELKSMKLNKKGFDLDFTHTLDPKIASNSSNYLLRRYYYSYHRGYGSPQREVETVRVVAARQINDTTISIELESLKPDRLYELKLSPGLCSIKGLKPVNTTAFYNALQLR